MRALTWLAGIAGVMYQDAMVNDLAFNVLALEALFMIPRICSILSLSPYWGTLIPCLKEMGKDFLKFMVLVVIVYVGFLTTFALVGRDSFDFTRMAGILTKIFYGSSSVGFEIMSDIDPYFGPPLMVLFITLSSFLLMGSLTGMLSNSFSRVIAHAKEEYLYVYSVYVLEASTSNRLTHFYPPFNLLAFVVFRPWRLLVPRDTKFRQGRILLLKATHAPIVGVIQLYEMIRRKAYGDEITGFKGPTTISAVRDQATMGKSPRRRLPLLRLTSQEETLVTRMGHHEREDDGFEAQSAVEEQIRDLGRKVDELTALIKAMQASKAGVGQGDSAEVTASM